jgi:hypothetical protein
VAEPPERVAAYSNWDHHLIRLHGESPLSSQFIVHYLIILVGAFNPSEKYERQLGLLFSIYGKIKVMFQTTNQIL